MKSDMIWTLVAFAFYLAGMLLIGAAYMKKTKSSEDFFLGGRGLNGWVAALSAQASDMSGWMLMGLPGAVYAFGTGQIWIAVGLLIGTILNWAIVSGRLRRYTIRANNSLTLPKYLENRFEDKHKIMLLVSSVAIVIFFLVYTASALSAGGKLFQLYIRYRLQDMSYYRCGSNFGIHFHGWIYGSMCNGLCSGSAHAGRSCDYTYHRIFPCWSRKRYGQHHCKRC